ncbi:SsrA-binding protein SmpB [Candidatus Parcubacteria bacterium]|nr:SsrA-binding protein SmpB [Candidatus Parcubacteria bacterium]
MAKKKQPTTKKIQNKRARYDYELGSEIVAGVVLNGRETKSLRLGHGHLRGAYVNIRNGEVWLTNATITSSQGFKLEETEQTRERKLLVKKKEIDALEEAKKQGKTIVPVEILTGGKFIKVKIAPGKGRKQYDKRELLKKRDQNRDIHRNLR